MARILQDREGRQGTEWFARENAIAQHLTRYGAPVIPLHPALPPGPHESAGYPMNFWEFVTRVEGAPDSGDIGRTLRLCHEILESFREPLPVLGILTETQAILENRVSNSKIDPSPATTRQILSARLSTSLAALRDFPARPLHGDAHLGNLMNTTRGLLWSDWEDAFAGPAEWDVASMIWNALILDEDCTAVKAMLSAYGPFDDHALRLSLIARAAVMSAWYPILYPNPDAERRAKLRRRIEWLERTE